MSKREIVVNNKGIKIHALVFNATPKAIPIVFIPGAVNSAEEMAAGLAGTLEHYHIIISLRGRGKSSAPNTGYTLTEQASDVLAVVEYLQLAKYYIFGFSLGTSVAIRAAAQNKNKVMGLILGDYPPIYPSYGEKWVARIKASSLNVRTACIEGLAADSTFENLLPELKTLTCPYSLFKAGQEGSLIAPQLLPILKTKAPDCAIVILSDSEHMLFDPDPTILVSEIRAFIDKCTVI